MNKEIKECLQCRNKAVRKIRIDLGLNYGYFCLEHDFNSFRLDKIQDYLEQKTEAI